MRKPARKAAPDANEPRRLHRRGAPNHDALSAANRAIRAASQTTPERLPISAAYRRALAVEVEESEATNPEALRLAMLREMRRQKAAVGGKLTVAEALAASLSARVADLGGRDAVGVMKELADRIEGPVVQRSADVSVSYVISSGPGSAPLTAAEWEKRALLDAARPALPEGSIEATARIAQGGRGA